VKDVKIAGRERTFLDRFEGASRQWSDLMVLQRVINAVPRYALEVIAFGGIILIVLQLLASGKSTATVLPLVGLYAFASYRLMPAVSQMFEAVAQLRFSLPSLDVLERDLAELEGSVATLERPEPRGLAESIELKGVSFSYPGSPPSLEAINLAVAKNSSVAFVGSTGWGKTTIVDVMLGLLPPTTGEVLIDGEVLEASIVRSWQASVGYVPQQVFLTDGTVADNIAFGVPPDEVDDGALERAAKAAQLHDFIVALPEGYRSRVGERGLRLSGGPTPTPRHRARSLSRPAGGCLRRGDQRLGQRHGTGSSRGPADAGRPPDAYHRGAPAVDGTRLRRHPPDRARPGGGKRHVRWAARHEPGVQGTGAPHGGRRDSVTEGLGVHGVNGNRLSGKAGNP